MSGADLPPVNAASSLLAVAPPVLVTEDASIGTATESTGFGTEELTSALVISQQISTPVHGMRRAASAPHSMDSLASSSDDCSGGGSGYLPPSGGPMRRVASSLGMRRSASFFWTPSAQCAMQTPNPRAALARAALRLLATLHLRAHSRTPSHAAPPPACAAIRPAYHYRPSRTKAAADPSSRTVLTATTSRRP